MRNNALLLLAILTHLLAACNLPASDTAVPPQPTLETTVLEPTTMVTAPQVTAPVFTTAQPPTVNSPTEAPTLPSAPTPAQPAKRYTNAQFGLAFEYPAEWNGPDEYVSGDTLRIAVGSGTIEPYGGSPPAQPAVYLPNAYQVVIQYTRNDHNPMWSETLQMLNGMQDGEVVSEARGMTIKVRSLKIGRFEGVEYIGTLSDTAQTEPVYTRQVILYDDQSNLITVMGTPNFVVVPPGSNWRAIYQAIDAANMPFFHQLIESLKINR